MDENKWEEVPVLHWGFGPRRGSGQQAQWVTEVAALAECPRPAGAATACTEVVVMAVAEVVMEVSASLHTGSVHLRAALTVS